VAQLQRGYGGKHSEDYHRYVYNRWDIATNGLSGAEAEKALVTELRKMRNFIGINPDCLCNTVAGKPTGWRRMRDAFGLLE
jgi:hypothetical protein